MNYFKLKYLIAYILIFLHFCGSITSIFAISLSSIWIFYEFAFKRDVNLFLVFLLLCPSIFFVNAVSLGDRLHPFEPLRLITTAESPWNFIRKNFNDVIFIGPIALSTRLSISLAIFTRFLVFHRNNLVRGWGLIWLMCLFLSIVGLIYSLILETVNPGGLTLGIRIVLTMGVLFLPPIISDRIKFYSYFRMIVFVSVIIFSLGLMNGHWYFVTVGLLPVYYFYEKKFLLRLLPLTLILTGQFINYASITVVGTFLFAFLFFFLIIKNVLVNIMLRNKYFINLFVITLIFLTTYVLLLPEFDFANLNTISGYTEFKILGDRKPVWDQVLQLTLDHKLFMPAGQMFNVYFILFDDLIPWPGGAHNIFLELGRQLGLLSMIVLSFLIISKLIILKNVLCNVDILIYFYCFLSIFFVLGFTGNSLIYDGVGTMYWILFCNILYFIRKNILHISFDSYK